MSTEDLLNDLREILDVETKAKDLYNDYLGRIDDKLIVDSLTNIRDDELEHVKLAGKLIDTIGRSRPQDIFIIEALTDFAESFPAVLVSTSVEKYLGSNLTILRYLINQKNLSCIYVAVNKPSSSLLRSFRKEGIDVDRMYFVDCTTVAGKEERRIVVSAGNLTDISIAISEWIQKVPLRKFVHLDAISTLYIFNPSDTVERFLHALVAKLRENNVGQVLIAMRDEMEKKSLDLLTSLCDSKIET